MKSHRIKCKAVGDIDIIRRAIDNLILDQPIKSLFHKVELVDSMDGSYKYDHVIGFNNDIVNDFEIMSGCKLRVPISGRDKAVYKELIWIYDINNLGNYYAINGHWIFKVIV